MPIQLYGSNNGSSSFSTKQVAYLSSSWLFCKVLCYLFYCNSSHCISSWPSSTFKAVFLVAGGAHSSVFSFSCVWSKSFWLATSSCTKCSMWDFMDSFARSERNLRPLKRVSRAERIAGKVVKSISSKDHRRFSAAATITLKCLIAGRSSSAVSRFVIRPCITVYMLRTDIRLRPF